MQKITLKIDGMHCENCAKRIEKALLTNEQIKKVSVDFSKQIANITYADISIDDIKENINNIGFKVTEIIE